jgi:hypothetical protein
MENPYTEEEEERGFFLYNGFLEAIWRKKKSLFSLSLSHSRRPFEIYLFRWIDLFYFLFFSIFIRQKNIILPI